MQVIYVGCRTITLCFQILYGLQAIFSQKMSFQRQPFQQYAVQGKKKSTFLLPISKDVAVNFSQDSNIFHGCCDCYGDSYRTAQI